MEYQVRKSERAVQLYDKAGFSHAYIPREMIEEVSGYNMALTFDIASLGRCLARPGVKNELRCEVQLWLEEDQLEQAVILLQEALQAFREARKEAP